ncbi:MAG: hypothetical protein BIFFINMI_01447 [Phycisphaerae bacterium]|nr:hypothetical protein [Phycisphaerae bacterium]
MNRTFAGIIAATSVTLAFAVAMEPAAAVAAQPAAFATKPAATGADGGAVITFAAATDTDVEVAVLNAAGRVVRHLAAGRLGANAPAPLQKDSLRQQLTWDGKDDLGKPAQGGPFKARVGLGVTPTFSKTIVDNPAAIGSVRGFAVGAGGELFVLHNHGSIHPDDNSGFCAVYGRDGKYLRTILPYPGATPGDKLPGVRQIALPDGSAVPFLYDAELRSIVPGTGEFILHQPAATRDGRFVFIGHQEIIGTQSRYNQGGVRQIVVLNRDGSMPPGGPLRTILADNSRCGGSLAVAPDDKTFYAADISTGSGKTLKVAHCVYRFTLDDKSPTPFIGVPDTAGNGPDRLNDPNSVSVDDKGNLYVADTGNNRVAAFDSAGKFIGEFKVDHPDRIAVNARTGAIYVTAGKETHELLRFDSIKSDQPACRVKVPWFVKGASHDTTILAVDAGADPAIVYYGTARSQYLGDFKVLRIADKGDVLAELPSIRKLSGPDLAGQLLMLTMDRVHDRLFFDESVYDPATGKIDEGLGKVVRKRDSISGVGTKGGNGSAGLDGRIYLMGYSTWMKRFDWTMKLDPFADGKDGVFINGGGSDGGGPDAPGSLRLRARGVTADPAGNIYALWQSPAKNASNYLALHAPTGRIVNADLVSSCMRGLESVRLDYQGNIYLMVSVRPRGLVVPDDFKNEKFPPGWSYKVNAHQMNWYELLYGCMVKFGPGGGSIVAGDDGQKMEYGLPSKKTLVSIKDAQWVRFGASPAASWRHPYPDCCDCESAQFDVDGYGRSFFPDCGRFRVGMLDSAGNDLGHFGQYGNCDDQGAGTKIPMYWPYTVAADNDGTIYVGDRLNRRIIEVKLVPQAQESVALP